MGKSKSDEGEKLMIMNIYIHGEDNGDFAVAVVAACTYPHVTMAMW